MDKIDTEEIIGLVEQMTRTVIANEGSFNELDSAAGDGDCGSSLAKGFKVLKSEWENLTKEDIGVFLRGCSMLITENCGGASGPIWGTAFMSASRYAKGKTCLSLNELTEMMQAVVDGIQKIGGARRGDKTLLDALIPSVESLQKSCELRDDIPSAVRRSAAAAVNGAEETKKIAAMRGRASYLGERSKGFPDAGAAAVGVIFTDLADKCFCAE